jgi:hypothetical protein
VLLSGWDEDVQKTVTSLHRERGIKLASQSGVAKIEKDPRTGKLRVFTFDSQTKAEGASHLRRHSPARVVRACVVRACVSLRIMWQVPWSTLTWC